MTKARKHKAEAAGLQYWQKGHTIYNPQDTKSFQIPFFKAPYNYTNQIFSKLLAVSMPLEALLYMATFCLSFRYYVIARCCFRSIAVLRAVARLECQPLRQ